MQYSIGCFKTAYDGLEKWKYLEVFLTEVGIRWEGEISSRKTYFIKIRKSLKIKIKKIIFEKVKVNPELVVKRRKEIPIFLDAHIFLEMKLLFPSFASNRVLVETENVFKVKVVLRRDERDRRTEIRNDFVVKFFTWIVTQFTGF